MKLKLTLNIGSVDQKKLGIDKKSAFEGRVIDVSPEAGDILLTKGWAVHPNEDKSAAVRASTATAPSAKK